MVHADFALAYAQLCMASAGLKLQLITVNPRLWRRRAITGSSTPGILARTFCSFLIATCCSRRPHFSGYCFTKKTSLARPTRNGLRHSIFLVPRSPGSPPASGDLLEMQRIPTGCLLIKMHVFDKLSKPYFRFETDADGAIVGEDYVFCDRARAAGFRIWCDAVMSREIGHIGQTSLSPPSYGIARYGASRG